jgi:hypothetical protein
MKKALFKEGDKFFHPEKNVFLMVGAVEFFENRGGYLYRMKVFNGLESDNGDPWKSYYQAKMLTDLVALKDTHTTKVLYGNRNLTSS